MGHRTVVLHTGQLRKTPIGATMVSGGGDTDSISPKRIRWKRLIGSYIKGRPVADIGSAT